jgi:hypothetical protein
MHNISSEDMKNDPAQPELAALDELPDLTATPVTSSAIRLPDLTRRIPYAQDFFASRIETERGVQPAAGCDGRAGKLASWGTSESTQVERRPRRDPATRHPEEMQSSD